MPIAPPSVRHRATVAVTTPTSRGATAVWAATRQGAMLNPRPSPSVSSPRNCATPVSMGSRANTAPPSAASSPAAITGGLTLPEAHSQRPPAKEPQGMPSVSGSMRSATSLGPAPVRLCMAIGSITVLPISTKNWSARIRQHSTTVRSRM